VELRAAAAKQDRAIVDVIRLAVCEGRRCPARLVRPSDSPGAKRAAVVLSHDSRQCAAWSDIADAAERLAKQGLWVLVVEHASPHAKSLQPLQTGDFASYYGVADMANRPPLALRVMEDLAAFRFLAGRSEVDGERIVLAGQGIGGIDACLAAAIEPRVAGVVSLDATTFRNWAETKAPEQVDYMQIFPYLPGMLTKADLDEFYAALAPRPLVLAKLKDGWPKAGFEQVAATAKAAYGLEGKGDALVVVSPREDLKQREDRMPEGVQKLLVGVARTMLPAPPTPGMIGARELLKPRLVPDSASGLICLVSVLGGVEQEFVDGGYRLKTWSFVNDNGPAQKGLFVTPMIFKKEGNAYKLTGIGKARANSGEGLQEFPFDLVAGGDAVGAGYFFGFYNGDPAAKANAGVVEFDEEPKDRITILTADGQMDGQKMAVGSVYREHSNYPRAYSIQAVSARK
jgi:dienelactone hydrolase